MICSEKERLISVLNDEEVDRPPVICPGGMMNAATAEILRQVREGFHTDSAVMAKTAVEVRRSTGFENFGVPFCMTVEAGALGSRVDLGNSSVEPRVLEYGARSLAEASALSAPNPQKDGRLPVVLGAISLLARLNGGVPVIGNLTGPVSLATSILDPLLFFRLMRKDAKGVHEFLEFLTDCLAGFAREQIQAGADAVCIADPSATGEILGRNYFRDFAVPCLTRLVGEIRKAGAGAILHICGDTSLLFEELNTIGGAALSFDSVVSMKKARENIALSPLMGNINTQLLHQGTPERVRRAVAHAIEHRVDIIAPACGLSMDTPLENLRVLTDTVKNVQAPCCGERSGL